MKKTLITLAAVAATGVAFAQSSVTISGALTAAYERYGIVGDAQLSSYGTDANYIYFQGTEDLGGGLKVSFDLQKRFNIDTGIGNGKEFENSFITVAGKFGAMKVGRHQAISVAKYDIFGGSGTNATNAGTAAAYYAYNNLTGSRYDDAISYTTPSFSGFKATAVTTLSPVVNTQREATAVSLNYDNGPLSLAAVVEQTPAATVAAKRTDKNIGASYNFGMAKALLLWGQEGNAKSRTTVGVIVPVGAAITLKAAFRTDGETVSSAGVVSTTKSVYALGAEYALSKRTQLFAHYGDSDSQAQAAYRVGLKHTF